MSKFVDERVVEMTFENGKFEKNVRNSMDTIDDLKTSLDFSGVANKINGQIDGISVNGLVSTISSAARGFTAFEIAGITAIANITNKMVDMGIGFAKALSTDNIGEGWTKFGQIAISEATLLAQGIETYDGEITDILAKLTWYADETSYSLTDMVDNMSKFTAAGRTLDESANAMMGIANWAALAGQNSQKASTAMYQLSQALGKGEVRWMDYKSIVNANMDMQEFRKNALDTAVAMGQLTQDVDGMYVANDGRVFDSDNFTDSLTSSWFTSDVLLKVLNDYAEGANKIYDLIEGDDEVNTATDAIKKYSDQIDAFALKAFLAAQEARTFKDTIMAVQDAVSSGYMMMFTNIFGSVNEAKVLWTDLANELYGVFTEGIWRSNEILEIWADKGGRDDLFANTDEETGAFWNLFNAIVAIKDLVSGAWRDVFGLSDKDGFVEQTRDIATQLKDLTARIKEFTSWLFLNKKATEDVTNILRGMFSIFKIIGKVVVAVAKGFAPLLAVFGVLGGQTDVLGFLGDLGYQLYMFAESDAPFDNITASITRFFEYFIKRGKLVKNYFDAIADGSTLMAEEIYSSMDGTTQWITVAIQKVTTAFNWLKNALVNDVWPAMIQIGQAIGWVGVTLWDLLKKTGALIVQFKNWIQTNEKIQNGLASISKGFVTAYEAVKKFFGAFNKDDTQDFDAVPENVEESLTPLQKFVEGLVSLLEGFWSVLKAVGTAVGQIFFFIGNVLDEIGKKLKVIFTGKDGAVNFAKIFTVGFMATLVLGVLRFADMLRSVTAVFRDAFDSMFDYFNSKALEQYMNTIRSMAISILMMVGALLILASMDTAALAKSMTAMTLLVGFIVGAIYVMKELAKVSSSISKAGGLIRGVKAVQTETYNLMGMAAAFIAIGASVLLLTLSLKMLSKMEPLMILKGMIVIALMLVMLVSVMKLVGEKEKGINKAVKSMVKVALAIALLVRPLKKIGSIDTETGIKGLIGIAVIMGVLTMYSRYSKTVAKGERAIHSTLAMALALNLLMIPLHVIGGMDNGRLIKALGVIFVVFLILVRINKVSEKQLTKARMQNMARMMWALIPMAIGMTGMAVAMLAMGSLRLDTIVKSLVAMAAILYALVKVNIVLENKLTIHRMKNMARMFAGLIVASIGMTGMAIAMLAMGSLPLLTIIKSLGAMAIIMYGLVKVNKVLDRDLTKARARNMARMFLTLIPAAIGMVSLGTALAFIGNLKWKTILNGLGMISLMLVVLGALAYGINYIGGQAAFALLGLSLIPFAIGLTAVMTAVTLVGLIPFDQIVKGLKNVAAVFIALTILGYLIQPVVPALLGVALAAYLFAIAIKVLVMAMAAMVTVVSVSGVAFAAAMVAMSAAVLVAVPLILAALWLFVEGIAKIIKDAIPLVVDNIVLFVTKMVEGFITIIPILATALLLLTKSIIKTLAEVIPEIIELLIGLIDYLFTALFRTLPGFVEKWIDYFIAMMEMLKLKLPTIMPAIGSFIVAFYENLVDTIKVNLPRLIDAGFDLILALLEGIGNAVVEKAPLFRTAIDLFCSQIWEGIKAFFRIGQSDTKMGEFVGFLIGGMKAALTGGVVGFGLYIVNWLVEVLAPLWEKAKVAGSDLLDNLKAGAVLAWTGVKEWFDGKVDEITTKFDTAKATLKLVGSGMMTHLKDGVTEKWTEVSDYFTGKVDAITGKFDAIKALLLSIGKKMIQNLKDGAELELIGTDGLLNWFVLKVLDIKNSFNSLVASFKQIGVDMITGMVNGIIETWESIPDLLANLGGAAVKIIKEVLGIKSPSRVFAEIGKNLDLGLAEGISDNSDSVYKATGALGDDASDGLESSGLSKVLQDLNKSLEADFDNEIVIRPVMDLSEIQNGKNMLYSMMKEFDGYGISGSNSIAGSARDQINKVVSADGATGADSETEGTNGTGVINNTFNIQGSNPKEIAAEVSRVLKIQVDRRNAHGLVKV